MKEYTIQDLKSAFKRYNYVWGNFNIIAIRSKEDRFDEFDDKLYLVWNNSIWSYTATTNPGSYYLITKWLNPNGCAVIRPGQYINSHTLGIHRGHPALIQAGYINMYRDNNRNQKSGDGNLMIETRNDTGIDIHGTYLTYKIDKIFRFSAGCVVINDPNEFINFLNKCRASKQKYFSLTLLEEF